MTAFRDVQVNDDVVMVFRTGYTNGGKSTDRVVPAVVVEAKRVNLKIAAEDGNRWIIRRDTAKEPSATRTMYGWRAFTKSEYEQIMADREAWAYLASIGIRVGSESVWASRRAALAEILRAATADLISTTSKADGEPK